MKTTEIGAPPARQVHEFGDFRLDVTRRLLSRRDGTPVRLTPRVFDTLTVLVGHAQTVLDKERLMEAVWPDTIVEENNLSQNISTLRRVLGDQPGSNRYIATVPGRGYRFVADVTTREVDDTEGTTAPAQPQAAYPATPSRKWRRVAIPIIAGAVLIVAALLLWRTPPKPAETALPQEKGIAVLPFEDLSAADGDSFFADGIQDDILTTVGKMRDLKVIARASVMDYRGARLAGKVREIGRALGVSHVVEGSVRRAGDRVVVSVALIDARDERQVWSERYERSLTDALSLQAELAAEIARELHASVAPLETASVAPKPTADPEAYLLYLRARDLEHGDPAEWPRAAGYYEAAVARDPAFALAHARLAIRASELSRGDPAGASWAEKARRHAAEAFRLQPELGETRLALTNQYLMVERDHERALMEARHAAELLPNSAEVWLTIAFIHKLQNGYGDRLAALHRAEALDPRNTRVLSTLARTQRWVRDWAGALQTLDRIAVIERNAPVAMRLRWVRASDEFRQTGNIEVLIHALAAEAADVPPLAGEWLARSRFEIAMLEREYETAAQTVTEFSDHPPGSVDYKHLSPHTRQFYEALPHVARGNDPAAAAAALNAAAANLEQIIGHPAAAQTRPAELHAELAVLYAFLGRKEEAIATAQRAMDLEASGDGSVEKNARTSALALVHARSGEPEKALDLIEHLLSVPCELQSGEIYNMTVADLRLRWVWEPLRDHSRFQKLLAGPEPKTAY